MEQPVNKYNNHEDKLTNSIKYQDAHRRTKYNKRHVVEFEMSCYTLPVEFQILHVLYRIILPLITLPHPLQVNTI